MVPLITIFFHYINLAICNHLNSFYVKNIITNSCKEKTEWVENTSDATTQDFISQRQNLDEIITPIIQKLNEPGTNKIKTRTIIQIITIKLPLNCSSLCMEYITLCLYTVSIQCF